MNMALVKQIPDNEIEPLYFRQAEARVTMELDNVAHGLKYFADQLEKTQSAHARFATVVQLKTWVLNKPTVQVLLDQYLIELEHTQQSVHLDPQSHDESVQSLCDQLKFLSAVFEQESELIDQMVFCDPKLVVCD